ncbi:MAG: PAS domain-containing sensor histidine kinase [Spirochaetia bacterium]|nr:PAS domain-containing sensor histidine kinase [Spirochaetia bacterium]
MYEIITGTKNDIENLKLYKTLLKILPVAVVILDGKKVLYANDQAFKILKAENKLEISKKNLLDVVHPDYKYLVKKRIKKMLVDGNSVEKKEEKFVRFDGEIIDVEVSAEPVELENKRVIQLVFQDITEKKKALESIKESEQKLSLHIQHTPLGVISWDINFNVILWNPAAKKIFGYSKEEAVGKNAFDLIVPKEERAYVERVWNRLIEQKKIVRGINENITKDDQRIYCQWHNTALLNEKNNVIGVTSIVHDITREKNSEIKLRKAKKEAEKATQLKDKFVSLVAHDLKNKIHPIMLLFDLIKNTENIKEIKDFVETGIFSCGEMVHLINDILKLTRIQLGKINPSFSYFNAHSFIEAIIKIFDEQANKKGIQIINKIDRDLEIYADISLFKSAVSNLISNAVKFCRKGDKIKIHTSKGNTKTIVVEDTGIGIDDVNISHLFKFETKYSTKGTAGEEGTGFGLPLVKEIMDAHNGSIEVKSKPGKGTVFYLNFNQKMPVI